MWRTRERETAIEMERETRKTKAMATKKLRETGRRRTKRKGKERENPIGWAEEWWTRRDWRMEKKRS